MGPGALRSGRTLARAPGLPPGSGRNRGAGGRGGVGGRDPRELWRGGEPGSKGEGEGGGAEETLLQHGVSSPRGGCKHGTRALFQGSPLKGQRLRRDLDSAAAFITSGARTAPPAGRRAGPGSCRDPGGVPSLPAAGRRDRASAAAWHSQHPAHGAKPPSARGQGPPRPLRVPEGGAVPPLHLRGPGTCRSSVCSSGKWDNANLSVKRVFFSV